MIDEEILAGIREIREKLRMLEKTDSITVSKGMAGKYSWDVKIYADLEDDLKKQEALNKIVSIDSALKAKFGGEKNGV